MSSFSQQQHHHGRRRRHHRNTASAVVTTAATAAVAYGSYRLAQWYLKEDDESEVGVEHPLEEDFPSVFEQKEQDSGTDSRNQNDNSASPNGSPNSNNSNSNSTYSWMSSAAVGVASWLIDAGSEFPIPGGGGGISSGFGATRAKPTRRQQLIRCRCQSRIAFQTCFQTLKPVLETLTDSSRQTKELKVSRRRRQALKKLDQQEQSEDEKKGGSDDERERDRDGDACTSSTLLDKNQRELELRILQEREEELWREILVETTTRMMVSSYAYTLLLLSLTVQFHWLASAPASDFSPSSSKEQQREREALLMKSHQYFLDEGIPLLVSTVRRSVERVFFGDDDDDETDEKKEILRGIQTANRNNSYPRWSNPSSQFVSSDDIEQTLYHRLPHVLNDLGMGGRQRRSRRRRNWIRFVLPDEEVFDPVWDVCKGPVWEDAQEQVLGHLWYKILRDGEFENPSDCGGRNHGWGELFRSQEIQQQQQQPLAKLMAHFKKTTSALFEETADNQDGGRTNGLRGDTQTRTTVGKVQTLPTVLELGDISLQ